ncbi:hypothetical protein [Rhodoferax sp.]|jgi:hypothetical protein|uniref:hypothetical protein n=1 Tax=Rhodoferax sp. TaxID=50421 RepID=UPI0037839437
MNMSFKEEHALETYRSLISVSMEGLKSLLLVNGGAVVAVVAFLGQSSLGPELSTHFWWPLGFFIAGLTLCVLAFVGSYATQLALFNERLNHAYKGPRHMVCAWATVLLVFLSIVTFAMGAFSSVYVLSEGNISDVKAGAKGDETKSAQAFPSKPVTPAASK